MSLKWRRNSGTSRTSEGEKVDAAEEKSVRMSAVNEELNKLVREDLTHAPARRRVREAFKETQLGIDHCLLKASYPGVKTKELYEVNSRGLEIFTKSWLPEASPLKAIVCHCHDYGDTCTFFFEGIAKKLASSGYGVFSMDYPGMGLSEGLHGYIPNFEKIVDDAAEHFSKVKENPQYRSLPSFLFGQSMGGALALKVHLKQPNSWSGAVLLAPMCKISEEYSPPWLMAKLLISVAKVLPKRKLYPHKDYPEAAFRDMKKRNLYHYNVIAYKHKPRLGTALQLIRTTQEIERRLEEVSLPLLILHGEADAVTDPLVSQALYEKAKTFDKKIYLYKDSYHALLEGEPDEMIFHILNDITSWLDARCIGRCPSLSTWNRSC